MRTRESYKILLNPLVLSGFSYTRNVFILLKAFVLLNLNLTLFLIIQFFFAREYYESALYVDILGVYAVHLIELCDESL